MKQISRLSALFSTLLFVAVAAGAQELPAASPESVGMSSERLQRIGATVQRQIDEKRIAGAVTMVLRHGKTVWFDARGFADREARRPMEKDALFRICSMTKPITSLAVMMLYEEGHFLLTDPVSKYLPEFKDIRVLVKSPSGEIQTTSTKREMMILDLLRHTSGLTYPWDDSLGKLYTKAGVGFGLLPYHGTLADNIKALASVPLLFSPGERFEYSVSVDVLGRLVEVISGLDLNEFFQKRIFQPLGMTDTCFFPPADKLARLAAAYTYREGEGLKRFPDQPIVEGELVYSADYPYAAPRKLFSGGGGLCSTVTDYARFCQMMLSKGQFGSKRLLSRKSVELMTTDRLGTIVSDQGFGLGFSVDGVKSPLTGLGSPGQYGWGGFFYTNFVIDPKEDLIVIFLGQLHPDGGLKLDALTGVLAQQAIVD